MVKRAASVIFLAFWCFIASGKPSAAGQRDDISPTGAPSSTDQSGANSTTAKRSAAGQSEDSPATGANIYSSIAPPFLTPGKDLFVTREGDSFVVTITSTCFLEDESESQFLLLAPTPEFIHVSESYRREIRANGYAEGIGVVYVAPQIGDAGKYLIKLQVKACNGKVERVISFRLHIKPAI